jgi:HEAT repeat protein
MKNDRVQQQLEHLKSVRSAGHSQETVAELRKALRDKVNLIVAKAAAITGEWQESQLLPDLLASFDRLFVKAAEGDPQCWGKNAISQALKDLGCDDSAVFLRGVQHHQWEPVRGGKSDTAGVLRATCALALVQCRDIRRGEILLHLVNAVTEDDAKVRADAARALEHMGGEDAALLLRLKARAGDEEVRVTGQVLESLLELETAAGIPFVAEFLHHKNEEVREEAALALGASRLPEALAVLQAEWTKVQAQGGGAVLLRAMSTSRLDPALDFLLQQVRTARLRVAEEALQALELHRESEQIVARVAEAVAGREELETVFRRRFT